MAELEFYARGKRRHLTDDSEDEETARLQKIGKAANSDLQRDGSEADGGCSEGGASVASTSVHATGAQGRRTAKKPVCPVLGLPSGWNLKIINESQDGKVRNNSTINILFLLVTCFPQAGHERRNDISAYLNRTDSGSQFGGFSGRWASRNDMVNAIF